MRLKEPPSRQRNVSLGGLFAVPQSAFRDLLTVQLDKISVWLFLTSGSSAFCNSSEIRFGFSHQVRVYDR